jgi:hypothetical protein
MIGRKVLHLAANDLIRELEALNKVSFGPESIRIVNEHMGRRESIWIAEVEKVENELTALLNLLKDVEFSQGYKPKTCYLKTLELAGELRYTFRCPAKAKTSDEN